VIVFAIPTAGFFSVPASGGKPVVIKAIEPRLADSCFGVSFLPDGKHFFYTARVSSDLAKSGT